MERFLAETHEHIQDENEVSINSQAEELPALAVTADVPQYSEPTAAKVHGVGDKLVSLSVEINEMTGEGRETGLFGMETLDQPRPALDVPKCVFFLFSPSRVMTAHALIDVSLLSMARE